MGLGSYATKSQLFLYDYIRILKFRSGWADANGLISAATLKREWQNCASTSHGWILHEGKLQALKDRLADANRDLRRAKGDEEKRIQAEIEELKAQIKAQQKIVDNPEAAKEQTQKNIKTGLERERQPEKPATKKTSTKFINPPPGIAPNYFQDRQYETGEIVKFLNDDAQRLMTVVGRGGVGKTAMVCRLLKALEGGQLPDDLGEMKVDGIVYLSESGSHRVNFPNIFADLSKLLPSETTDDTSCSLQRPESPRGKQDERPAGAFPGPARAPATGQLRAGRETLKPWKSPTRNWTKLYAP